MTKSPLENLTRKDLAGLFKSAEKAAREEAAEQEQERLEAELVETKRRSVEAFDRRAERIEEARAQDERIGAVRAKIAAAEAELEEALRERQHTGHRESTATREGKELARAGRKLEEALGLDEEERVFGQSGTYSKWPQTGVATRSEAGLPEEHNQEEV